MLELGTLEHEPSCLIVTVRVLESLTFDGIEDRNRLFRLLLLLQLLILLNDNVSLLNLNLVSFNLVCGERNPAETVQKWEDVICLEVVLCESKELEGAVLLEDLHKLFD